MHSRYSHLTLAERREIYALRSAKVPPRVIAQRLGRHPSTIYREVSRNWFFDDDPVYRGYFHVTAHGLARDRRRRLAKIHRSPILANYVISGLRAAWSPEQIAGRLRLDCSATVSVSHETIYRFVYSPSIGVEH